jgi:ferredoxin
MGHSTINPDREYRLLQQALDRQVTGAPDSAVFRQILQLLYSPEEAALVRRVPIIPTPLDKLAARLDLPPEELDARLTCLAERGLILDLTNHGRRYFALPPVVIGFFEFVFMRVRDDVPLAELAALFDAYMREPEGAFARSVFRGRTQLGRSLVREDALPDEPAVEVLDWERATALIADARAVAVSLCACRHKATHLDHACDRPLRTCLSLNGGAEMLIRTGNAEAIDCEEALDILAECKAAGLAQTADNVQHNVSYICNCCGCCCGMMQAIRDFDLHGAIVTSNWSMAVDMAQCNGCGKCVAACPVGAIELAERREGRRRIRWAMVEPDMCLGCGTCSGACKFGGITMVPRPQRTYTPQNMVERTVAMALERGKLADVVFGEPEKLSGRAVGRIARAIEHLPPARALLASETVQSAFLGMVGRASRGG